MLSRKEFDQWVLEGLRTYSAYETVRPIIELTEQLKNNGVVRRGVAIWSSDRKISMNIYLEEYYEAYKEGRSCGGILQQLAEHYERNKLKQERLIEAVGLDFEEVREKIIFQVVNMKKNKQLLQQRPYHELGNGLAMIYAQLVELDGENIFTTPITRERAQLYGYDMEQMKEDAVRNTVRELPPVIANMEDMLREIMEMPGENGRSRTVSLEDAARDPELISRHASTEWLVLTENRMFVLTNNARTLGAAALYYPGAQEQIARAVGGSYYVLPSSTHELIILPDTGDLNPAELEGMVKEINETQVALEAFLSDQVLRYDHMTKELYRPLDRVQERGRREQETERTER